MMLPPEPCLYIRCSTARVVRNAPSRWMLKSFFQSANLNSSSGATIWMPALLTSTSIFPNCSTVRDAGLDLLFVRHVHDDAERLARVAEFRRGRVGGLLIQIGDHDLCALAREGLGDPLADATGGAGHDGNFVLEAHVTKLPRRQVSAPARAWRRPAAGNRKRLCRDRA